jgi:hypothetical protein
VQPAPSRSSITPSQLGKQLGANTPRVDRLENLNSLRWSGEIATANDPATGPQFFGTPNAKNFLMFPDRESITLAGWGKNAYGGTSLQDRWGLECILGGRHSQSARGDRADHIPPIHAGGWTRRIPAKRTRPTGLVSRSSGASSPKARTRSARTAVSLMRTCAGRA